MSEQEGSIYFDEFESRRYAYIGLLPDLGNPDPEPVAAPSWNPSTYAYNGNQPHAATSVDHEDTDGNITTDSYTYDANSNMTCRIEETDEGTEIFNQIYNAENRIATIQQLAPGTACPAANTSAAPGDILAEWLSSYDGDGTRVAQVYNDGSTLTATAYFAGGLYEVVDEGNDDTIDASKKYYAIAGQTIAMDDGTGLQFILKDHLGSVAAITAADGTLISEQRYLPFGELRTDVGIAPITQTDFGYTGQRNMQGMGLMDYNARFYSPNLGKFIQPDTIIPSPANPQTWNRYSYVANNPIKYIDPSGHKLEIEEGSGGGSPPDPIDLSGGSGGGGNGSSGDCNPSSGSLCIGTDHGLCLGSWGCSGESELLTGMYSPQWWADLSLGLTDAAYYASATGGAIEVTLAGLGATGGPLGFVGGAVLGNWFHMVVTNPLETTFSYLSVGSTFIADAMSGTIDLSSVDGTITVKMSDSFFTAATTQTLGFLSPVGVLDAGIDAYASDFGHGNARGVLSSRIVEGVVRLLGGDKLVGYTLGFHSDTHSLIFEFRD